MSAWWAGLPPAEAAVECGGHVHTLRWQAGVLTAVDHGDPEDEATLAALAGESFACLELLRAWARRRNDPRVLTLASRGATDLLNVNLDHPGHRIGPARPRSTGHAMLDATRPQLHAALYGRVLTTLRAWLGEPNLTIELAMTARDGEPPCRGRA